MNPLDYYLPQPVFELSPDQKDGFDALLASTPSGGWIDYRLESPKWQFLSYLCQSKNLVLHGSQNHHQHAHASETDHISEVQPLPQRKVERRAPV